MPNLRPACKQTVVTALANNPFSTHLSKIYSGIIFVFLFAPIVVLLIFSFNEGKSLSVFSGFSLKWYEELFADRSTLESVKNTLLLAASATAASMTA